MGAPLLCPMWGQGLGEPSCEIYLLGVEVGSLMAPHLKSTLKGLKELSSGILVLSHRKTLLLRVSPGKSSVKCGHSQGCLLYL